jgi:uncharacterized protein (DUF1501 family)
MQHTSDEDQCGSCTPPTISRRRFLGRTGWTAAALASAPAWMPRVAFGAPRATPRGAASDTLVHIFLRGGFDGLSACVPYGDAELYLRRPTLAVTPPGTFNGAVDLDGFFGLAPAAAPLLPIYQSGRLAFVHASGSVDPSRSHFDAQKFMEIGLPGAQVGNVSSGWIARHLQTVAPAGNGLLRGMALADQLPRVLVGAPATLPTKDPDGFTMPGTASTVLKRRQALRHMYQSEAAPLGSAALSTFSTIDLLATIDFAGYVPANGATYPNTTFGKGLKSIAALIKADLAIECLEIDVGGWDLHNQLGPVSGAMATRLDELAKGLRAFDLDMGSTLDRVTLVAMSEFGRRAAENASGGVDHGHGNCMLVMGGHIAGGQVLTQWPGLAPANLDQGDLAITIDYRDILSEILAQRLGSNDLATVFPNHTPSFHGITA